MIYCVWYPSGGFGHYMNAVLSLYGRNFVRPKNDVKFGNTGDLHQLDLIMPRYYHNEEYPTVDIDPNQNYSVLIDNGINDESIIFKKRFLDSTVIKICYSDKSWPIVAKTLIVKAMNSKLDSELKLDQCWPESADWAVREKYFLYLRDHPLRQCWKSDSSCNNLFLDSLLDYNSLQNFINSIGISINNFESLHNSMLNHNQSHFYGVQWADRIIQAIENDQHIDIGHVTDLWDQSVVNYFIHLRYGFEVPANTQSNWFQNTKQIKDLL